MRWGQMPDMVLAEEGLSELQAQRGRTTTKTSSPPIRYAQGKLRTLRARKGKSGQKSQTAEIAENAEGRRENLGRVHTIGEPRR